MHDLSRFFKRATDSAPAVTANTAPPISSQAPGAPKSITAPTTGPAMAPKPLGMKMSSDDILTPFLGATGALAGAAASFTTPETQEAYRQWRLPNLSEEFKDMAPGSSSARNTLLKRVAIPSVVGAILGAGTGKLKQMFSQVAPGALHGVNQEPQDADHSAAGEPAPSIA